MLNYTKPRTEYDNNLCAIDALNDVAGDLRGLARLFVAVLGDSAPEIDNDTMRLTADLMETMAATLDAIADSGVMRVRDGADSALEPTR